MTTTIVHCKIPQWKKDLIERLRSQHQRTAAIVTKQEISDQNVLIESYHAISESKNDLDITSNCNMGINTGIDGFLNSDSFEDLQYGPGIVNKLKNKYLSMTLRDSSVKVRPIILPMRKATSLENILNDGVTEIVKTNLLENKPLESNNVDNYLPNRYRQKSRGSEMKRARSVEGISRYEKPEKLLANHTCLNQRYLKKEILDTVKGNLSNKNAQIFNNLLQPSLEYGSFNYQINRPKRIASLMNADEKPPVDVVKQTKIIFEKRPEQRTRSPPITGEVAAKVVAFKNITEKAKSQKPAIKVKPRVTKRDKLDSIEIVDTNQTSDLKRTNDLFLISSIPDVSRIDILGNTNEGNLQSSLSETPDLIMISSLPPDVENLGTDFTQEESIRRTNGRALQKGSISKLYSNFVSPASISLLNNSEKKNTNKNKIDKIKHKHDFNTDSNNESSTQNFCKAEIKRNVPKIQSTSQHIENNSIVFKFTHRKDVPDYVQNDGLNRAVKPKTSKVGESGIILLPDAPTDESFTDEDEEILRSLQAPPSPCDVMFINDNVLINGKSNINQKNKTCKMSLSFLETDPKIFEYPSELSLLADVLQIAGSSLTNYTPRNTTEFQPGVTRRVNNDPNQNTLDLKSDDILQKVENPILFSSGTNADMLF